MDLGLKSLDDDQLVNLLNEAVTELLARDVCDIHTRNYTARTAGRQSRNI